jgi:hypothetical protein
VPLLAPPAAEVSSDSGVDLSSSEESPVQVQESSIITQSAEVEIPSEIPETLQE